MKSVKSFIFIKWNRYNKMMIFKINNNNLTVNILIYTPKFLLDEAGEKVIIKSLQIKNSIIQLKQDMKNGSFQHSQNRKIYLTE